MSIRTLPTPVKMPHEKQGEAIKFAGSRHKGNRAQAFLALSKSVEDANEQLKRHGVKWQARKRVLYNFGHLVNRPDMEGEDFYLFTYEPLSDSIPQLPSKFDGYSENDFIAALEKAHEDLLEVYRNGK